LTFLGFASIPLYNNINPKNFPKETLKAHFVGLSLILCFRSVWEGFSEVYYVLGCLDALHQHII
jgi:hypothetical protein